MEPSHQLVAAGLERHQHGDLTGAVDCYQQALVLAPQHPDAWNLLGLAAWQQGATRQAIECIAKAVSRAPRHAPFQINLGNALLDADRLAEAEAALRQAVALAPAMGRAWLRLGVCLDRRQQTDEAIGCLQRAADLDPHCSESCSALAETLARLDRLPAAKQAYLRLLERHSSGRALSNFGNVLLALGESDAAIEAYRDATRRSPELAEPHFNLGTALALRHCYAEAAEAFRDASLRQPAMHAADVRLAECQRALGDLESARASLERAAAASPGRLLPRLRRELAWPEVWANQDEIDAHRRSLSQALERFAAERLAVDVAELDGCGAEPPAQLAYHGRNDRPLKEQFAGLFAPLFPPEELPRPTGKPHIGFVVTAGHEGVFLRGMGGLLTRLDHEQVRVTVVCNPSGRAKLQASLHQSPGGPSIELLAASTLPALATAIRQAQCDILYYWEVGTDATNYFLPFLRLANVQCTSWGWPVTSGIPNLDLFLSSNWLEPETGASHYSERLVLFNHVPNYYERPRHGDVLADKRQFGFADRERVYLCPQNPLKLQPDFDALLAALLTADSQATIALLEAARPAVTRQLQLRLANRCGDQAGRIRWLPRVGKADYRRLIAAADVVLDTIHYGGGANTTYDALGLGAPLVTLPGEFHRGRYAAGAYRRMGLSECISATTEDYVRIAVRIAHDQEYRALLRDDIRARSDVLFDNAAAVREFQNWLLQTAEEARAGRPPCSPVA